MSQEFDLFGNPIVTGQKGRGRPKHVPTPEIENKIKMLLSFGWSNERIARAVGVSQPTLRRNYFQVLKLRDYQRDMMTAAKAMKLWELGMAGNVGAFKAFEKLLERNDMMKLDADLRDMQNAGDDEQEDEIAPRKLGKKEQAQADAESAMRSAGDWGGDLAFRGSVN
ncbi:hypothetical protein [Roseibium aggregatum]|uniref:hypothetical protein n=1 Tax=Roseibium aggregatum TaxID=187304 RepID=UPI001E34C742|nr:hypothetical protein [Roseibium aggregatum]